MSKLKASLLCATSAALAALVLLFVNDPSVNFSGGALLACVAVGSSVWVLSFLISSVVLYLFAPVYLNATPTVSLVLFAILGVSISLGFMFGIPTLPAEGVEENVEEKMHSLATIVTYGVVGLVTGLTAWFAVKPTPVNSRQSTVDSSKETL